MRDSDTLGVVRSLFPALLLFACNSPEYLALTAAQDVLKGMESSSDGESSLESTAESSLESTAESGSSEPATGTGGESDEGVSSGSESTSDAASTSTGLPVEDSAGDPPPLWKSLIVPTPVLQRGPLQIEAVTEYATAVELFLDGVSLGVFAPQDGKVVHELPIVFDGQDGDHMIDAVASSLVGEAQASAPFHVDLPPGGQEVIVPWLDKEEAKFSAAFAMARYGNRLVTLGSLDHGSGWRPVLREHGEAGELLGKRMLADWTERDDLLMAAASGFVMAVAFDDAGNLYVAVNLVPAGQTKPRGYLAGLTPQGTTIFPEVLLAPGEEIEKIVVRDGEIIVVGRREVADERTVAAMWGVNAATGKQAWAPVLVDAPDWIMDGKLVSARFHAVTFTNDGNLIAVGAAEEFISNVKNRKHAMFVRANALGQQLASSAIFSDQYFFLQTAALAVTAFTGPEGFCWTGWTKDGDFDPEMMVTHCEGETVVSKFTTDWKNSAGLAIEYMPLTGRIIVGGYRSWPGMFNNGWVMSFADSQAELESPHGWAWQFDSPVGGLDRVTAVTCQTYECDVLGVSDLLGSSQLRLGRLNQ